MYDIVSVREDFPVLKDVLYLDNAATTQTPVQAVSAMLDYFYKYAANHGRGAHRLARETTNHYEDSREIVASFFNAPDENIIFTKNATEGINIVSNGFSLEQGDHVIVTLVEHHSNLLPWMRLKEKGVEITVVEPDMQGVINPEDINSSITEKTKLMALNHVSNVFGSIQDIKQIISIAKQSGVKILVDCSQSAGNMPLDIKSLDPDFLVCPGHKGLLGPQGTGVLYIKEPETVKPLLVGGGMVSSVTTDDFKIEPSPAKFEAGTPNIPGVIGLGRAVEYVMEIGVEDIEKHEISLARKTAALLAELDGVEVYGPVNRAAVVSFNVPGMNAHDVAMILDQTHSICVRSGYHCAMPGISHLGVNGTVRASFALYNTEEEVETLVKTVSDITSLV
ncbi:MAG: cysteine desulfurase [Methanolobus sp.]